MFGGRGNLRDQRVRGVEQGAGRIGQCAVCAKQIRRIVKPCGEIGDVGVEGIQLLFGLGLGQLIGQRRRDFQPGRSDGLGERGVDFRRNLIRALVEQIRCQRVLLLVAVIGQFGMLHVVGEEGHHVFAERLRNYDGRVVFAGSCALDGIGFGRDRPIELTVGAQRVHHLIADRDFHRDQVGTIPLIHIRHREFQVLHIRERVPACGHVEPGEQAGNHHQADHDDDGDHVAGQAFDVAGK